MASLRTHSNNPADRVFWYKAEHWKADFKFGSAQYWYLGEKYKKRSEEDDGDPFANPPNMSANNAKNVSPHEGAAPVSVEGGEGQPYIVHPAIGGGNGARVPSREGQVEGKPTSIKKKAAPVAAPHVSGPVNQDISKYMSNNVVTRRFVTYDKNGILRPDL